MAFKGFLGILLQALVWSPIFLLVRVGVGTVPPLTLTFVRCAFSAAFLLLVSLFCKVSLGQYLKYWKVFFVSSLIGNTAPFLFCSLGVVTTEGSMAGIIEGSAPLFSLFFGYFLFQQRSLNKRKVLSLFMGFIGLLILFVPSLNPDSAADPLGMSFLIGMSSSFALGWLYVERHLGMVPPLVSSTIHLTLSTLMILPFCIFIDQPLWNEFLSFNVLFLGVVLGIGGTALGWLLFFSLIKKVGAQYISIATMLCPIFCIIWGKLFLDEPVTVFKILGVTVILSSVALMEEKLFCKRQVESGSETA